MGLGLTPCPAAVVKMLARYLSVCSQTDANERGLGEETMAQTDKGCWTSGLCGMFNEKAAVFLLYLFDFRVSFIKTIQAVGLTASGLPLLPAALWVSCQPHHPSSLPLHLAGSFPHFPALSTLRFLCNAAYVLVP